MNEKTQELLDRTFSFGVNTLKFLKKLPEDSVTGIPKSQVGRSAVSVGVHYDQAQGTASKKDFNDRIAASHREAKESIYWMRVLSELHADEKHKDDFSTFMKEAQELKQIFSAINKTIKKNTDQN